MPPSIASLPPKGLKPGVAQIGVLDARSAAARKKSDRRAADAAGAAKAIRRAAEVVDQGEIPVAPGICRTTPMRARRTLTPLSRRLRHGRRRVRMIVVSADIEMQPAGDRDAVLFVRGADRRPVVRHCHDRRSDGATGPLTDRPRWHWRPRPWRLLSLRPWHCAAAVVFAAVCFCSLSSFCSSRRSCCFNKRDLRLASAGGLRLPLLDGDRSEGSCRNDRDEKLVD